VLKAHRNIATSLCYHVKIKQHCKDIGLVDIEKKTGLNMALKWI